MIERYLNGFQVPWRGYQYLKRHPKLWRYAWISCAINLLITATVLFVLYHFASHWALPYLDRIPDTWWGTLLGWLLGVGLFLGLGICGVILWLLLGVVLGSYFNGLLAVATEKTLGNFDLKELNVLRQILDGLRNLLSLIFINCLLFLLQWIPVIGPPLVAVGAYYVNALLFGIEFLAYPLEIRGKNRKERLQIAKEHRAIVVGLGTALLVLAMVPVLGSFLLSTAVIGTVLLYRDLLATHQMGD